jgi:hypothetical protein
MRLFNQLAKQFNSDKLRTWKKTTIHSMIWRRYCLCFGEKKRRNRARYSGHGKSFGNTQALLSMSKSCHLT